jgi:predicted protein tyrosine phosphatase
VLGRNRTLADRLKVLFVCSKNQWRSPTAEAIYRDDPRLSVRSRGTSNSAVRTIRENDLIWADLVLVMEQKHRSRLLASFPDLTKFLTIHVLDIPDDYGYMDDDLVQLLRFAADPIIDDFQTQSHTES